MFKIAILVSGRGSNMQHLIDAGFNIDCVIADRNAQALEIAKQQGIATFQVTRENCSAEILALLKDRNIDLIVLAGFLSILKKELIQAYQIINIHPALLPKYSGKGMYGMAIHNAVFANNEKQTGVTVHFVNEGIDSGDIIEQVVVDITEAKSAQEIADKVLKQEWQLLPKVVQMLADKA